MPKHLKAGESFKLNCTKCGKSAYIDPGTQRVNGNKLYAIIICTDKRCGHKSLLDGTFPDQGFIFSP